MNVMMTTPPRYDDKHRTREPATLTAKKMGSAKPTHGGNDEAQLDLQQSQLQQPPQ